MFERGDSEYLFSGRRGGPVGQVTIKQAVALND
jgi:hypothetical protein